MKNKHLRLLKLFNLPMVKRWAEKNFFELIIVSGIIFFLFLLRSAGYFYPYFTISINFIMFTALIISVPIFKTSNKFFFLVTLIFWLFAGLLKVLKIEVWAERTAIYAFQALFVGVILFILEMLTSRNT
jgi:hypothetical protein